MEKRLRVDPRRLGLYNNFHVTKKKKNNCSHALDANWMNAVLRGVWRPKESRIIGSREPDV